MIKGRVCDMRGYGMIRGWGGMRMYDWCMIRCVDSVFTGGVARFLCRRGVL